MSAKLPASFWAKTNAHTGCVIWQGACNSKGYGCYAVDGVSQLAHRVAYEAEHGPIPEGMTIDHLCRVRNCVNTAHMEVVTVRENVARKRLALGDSCSKGHRIDAPEALYRRSNGVTECRACMREAKRRHQERAA